MEPNSYFLIALLLVLAIAALVALAWYRHLVIRIAVGLLAVLLSATVGIAIVNDYYGY
jgi:uncharacterized protein (DUF486 family)